MVFFFAFLVGMLHHVLPSDTPGGMVSSVSQPPAIVAPIV
jgi:hypothetical protein